MTIYIKVAEKTIQDNIEVVSGNMLAASLHYIPGASICDAADSYSGKINFSNRFRNIVLNYGTNTLSTPYPKSAEGFALLNLTLAERIFELENFFQVPAASININEEETVLLSLHAGSDETSLSKNIASKLSLTLMGDKNTLVDGKTLVCMAGTHSAGFVSHSNSFYSSSAKKRRCIVKYSQSQRKISAIVYAWVQPVSGYLTSISSSETRKKLIHCAFLSTLMRGTGRLLDSKYPFPSVDDRITETNRGAFISKLSKIPLYEIRASEKELTEWFRKQFAGKDVS